MILSLAWEILIIGSKGFKNIGSPVKIYFLKVTILQYFFEVRNM